jgi:hypothetical protein
MAVNLNNLTPVFENYWRFAAERQRIFLKRLAGEPQPWTDDPILGAYKFTNVFRAADRVSQYCIKQVIYEGGSMDDSQEVVFRILLFKLFNSIGAWESLTKALGPLTWKSFNASTYGDILGKAKAQRVKIWNAAYMQKPQYREDLVGKHNRYLALLEHLMRSGVTQRLLTAKTYELAYKVLRAYPLYGDFTAMQHLTDLNYSPVINFDEDDFIVPGPGAFDGINKCFSLRLSKDNPQDLKDAALIIEAMVSGQKGFLDFYGEKPVTLFGRKLHAIDCQNLFCETDKYARVAHPEFNLDRSEIKQKLKPAGPLPAPFFPPKWRIFALFRVADKQGVK